MFSGLLFADITVATLPVFIILPVLMVIAILSFLLLMVMKQYKRCPSNRVLVIWGRGSRAGRPAKTIHSGGQFVLPLLEDYAYLSLEPLHIEILLQRATSTENIRVNVSSVFTVAVDTTPAIMQQAAIHLLGLSVREIRKHAEEIISGQLRQVIASMGIAEINRDRDVFLNYIQKKLEPELNKIGLKLISGNVTDMTDESGYIDAIGQKATIKALLRKLLEEDKLSEEDRDELRRMLDGSAPINR